MSKDEIADRLYGKKYDELDSFEQLYCDWYDDVLYMLVKLRKYANHDHDITYCHMIGERQRKLEEIENSIRNKRLNDISKKVDEKKEESIQREILEELKGLRKDISKMNDKLDFLNTPLETIN